MTIRFLLLLLVLAGGAQAQEAFVLRSYGWNQPEYATMSGISLMDAPGSYTHLRSFPYVGPGGGEGMHLAAKDDLLIIQGPEYFEFDIDSQRLLRRYQGVADWGYGDWGFHGVAVDDETASRLGLEAGFYGYPECRPGIGIFHNCGVFIQPPGWSEASSNTTDYRYLYRRPFDPADAELQLVNVSSTHALRKAGLDPDRGLWLFSISRDVENEEVTESWSLFSGGSELLVHETRYEPSNSSTRRPLGIYTTGTEALSSWAYTREKPWYRLTRKSLVTFAEDLVESGDNQPVAFAPVPSGRPARRVQVIPAIGSGPGANQTFWSSDLWMFNPAEEPLRLTMRRVTRPGETVSVTMEAKSSMAVPDVLRSLGGGHDLDGTVTDALVIESEGPVAPVVVSRTWTTDPETGGSFGQGIPAVPTAVGYSNHLPHFGNDMLVGIRGAEFILDQRDPSRYRHNIGIVNDDSRPLSVRLRYGLTFPPPIDGVEQEIIVAPQSVANVSVEGLFPADLIGILPPRVVVSADRPAPVWLSMVDNRTGDATFVPFSLLALMPLGDDELVLPAVAHTPGGFGTFWRTDLYGLFPPNVDEPEQAPRARVFSSDCDATDRLHGVVGPEPPAGEEWVDKWISVFPDLRFQLCGTAGRAMLKIEGSAWTAGFSRTYTTREDGGTFGEMIPFYPARGNAEQHFAGVRHDEAFRSNLGLANAGMEAAGYELRLYRADGELAAERLVTLAAGESRQSVLDDWLGPDLDDGLYGLSVTPLDAARVWAYVSVVDNRSGDPTNWW